MDVMHGRAGVITGAANDPTGIGGKMPALSTLHMIIQHEELLAAILHDMLAQVIDKISDIHRFPVLLPRRDRKRMLPRI